MPWTDRDEMRTAAMPDSLSTLRSSVHRLTGLVRPLDDDALANPAYPTEWSIADVVSHLGSGAVIWSRRIDDGLAGTTTPDDFNQAVWARWDAKTPRSKADDGLAADAELIARLETVAADDRTRLRVAMGPMELDWDACVRMRLSEHLLHEWDVAVALEPAATLADDGTAIVVDNLELIAGYASKPVGEPGTITIATTAPERSFAITIGDNVTLAPTEPTERPTLSMPAEAFVRLVYGRLDPEHAPPSITGNPAELDRLRQVFTGL